MSEKMTTSEPTTGEIVSALRNCPNCDDCLRKDQKCYRNDHDAADRLESQEQTISALTARAERAERELIEAYKALASITPQIINGMRYCTDPNSICGEGCPAYSKEGGCRERLMKDAADALESLQREREQSDWIPCSERLPEDDDRYADGTPKQYRVTVINNNGLPNPIIYSCDATRDYDTWIPCAEDEFEDWETVVAWFELPAPWSGEEA